MNEGLLVWVKVCTIAYGPLFPKYTKNHENPFFPWYSISFQIIWARVIYFALLKQCRDWRGEKENSLRKFLLFYLVCKELNVLYLAVHNFAILFSINCELVFLFHFIFRVLWFCGLDQTTSLLPPRLLDQLSAGKHCKKRKHCKELTLWKLLFKEFSLILEILRATNTIYDEPLDGLLKSIFRYNFLIFYKNYFNISIYSFLKHVQDC